MELTSRCKEEFYGWFYKQPYDNSVVYTIVSHYSDCSDMNIDLDMVFDKLPLSARWGIFEDYFDALHDKTNVKYLGDITKGVLENNQFFFNKKMVTIKTQSRNESRIEALRAANKIRNEELRVIIPEGI